MLLRATEMFGISQCAGALIPLPSAASTWRIARDHLLQFAGSSEAAWSGPGRVRSSVKCFSMTSAPKRQLRSLFRFPASGPSNPRAGRMQFESLHCTEVNLVKGRRVFCNAMNQSELCCYRTPVGPDRLFHFSLESTCRWKELLAYPCSLCAEVMARLVISPEGILYSGMFTWSAKDPHFAMSNGLERNWMSDLASNVRYQPVGRGIQFQPLQHFELGLCICCGSFLISCLVSRTGREQISAERLEFNRISAAGFGRVDQTAKRKVQVIHCGLHRPLQ